MLRTRQIESLIDNAPEWALVGIGVLLLAITIGSIYGRMNDDFGAKIFRIPKEQVRANWGHIMWLTVVPFFVTLYYFYLWLGP